MRNGLPPTNMDSFVWEAGEHAEHIYGDESTTSHPPYFEFTKVHRINTGITDVRDRGLTAGRGSWMPDAWGNDEFLAPPGEWSQSGSNGATAAMGFIHGTPIVARGRNANSGGMLNSSYPSPGEGYQPMFQHGVHVGWYSPVEVALSQTNFPAALRSIVNSDRYFGGEGGRRSILYEIGDITNPMELFGF